MNFNLNININIMEVKRYKAGTLKGELTTAEIRKLIRAHNKASSIKIPPKSTREDIVGILQKAGYVVNHEKAELRPVSKGKVQKLKVISQQTIAQELPKPKPLTEEQKKQRQQAKQKKAGEKAFLKAVIPKPPTVSKPSKGVKVGKPKKLNEMEKNRCLKAVNNALSVISLYEKKGGQIKGSDFSSKKDLMETIKDLNDVRPNLNLCPKTEQDIVDKALSLHSKGTTKKAEQKNEVKKVEEKKEEPEKKGKFDAFDKAVEEVKKEVPPIILEWLKIKKDAKLVATLKDKDGNTIKKVKGGRKPLFVKEQEKYRDMVWNKVKEIYKRNNVSMPKKSHGASLFARSKGDWKTYGGLPKELEEPKKKRKMQVGIRFKSTDEV